MVVNYYQRKSLVNVKIYHVQLPFGVEEETARQRIHCDGRIEKGRRAVNFISIQFAFFVILFIAIYYRMPATKRYIVIWIGSYIFYGWGRPAFLILLIGTTLWTYFGGIFLEKKNSQRRYLFFFTGCILILGIYKYTVFVLENLNVLAGVLGRDAFAIPEIVVPVGLSFYIFQVCTYLGDVHRGKIFAERNLIRYAAFVSFFPSILSGPIQKARKLLPQLREPAAFEVEDAIWGFLQIIWGIYEKICVADQLSGILNNLVIEDCDPWRGSWYLLSAVVFSIYIYADFAGYSDMAIGVARMLGIHLEKNFSNPYLSTTLSEFWRRWHVSLNEWLMEYVYIPLGGNRKGRLRKYCNVMVVFLVSGLWHGAYWHYVVWGLLNGFLVVVGEFTKPIKERIYCRLGMDETMITVRWWKRGIVFVFITATWLFFRNGIGTSCHMIVRMLRTPIIGYCNPSVWEVCGTTSETIMVYCLTLLFLVLQCQRNERGKFVTSFRRQPVLFQYVCVGTILVICIFAAAWGSATVNTEFLYFQF